MQTLFHLRRFKGFKKLYDYSKSINHPQREVIEKRLKIINFFDNYGEKATKDAFSVSRSTVYLWKKKLKEAKGSLAALAFKSKAPHNRRKRKVNPLIVKFIIDYRKKHPSV